MRISLKQTILLSTALFTFNAPLMAIEEASVDSATNTTGATAVVAEDTTPVLNGPLFDKAKKYSQKIFGSEIPSSFTVLFNISKLLNEETNETKTHSAEATSNASQTKPKGRKASAAKEVISAPLPEVTVELSESNVDQPAELTLLTDNLEKFTSGVLTLTAQHSNRPHPDFNKIYTTLADNFLETTLENPAENKAPSVSNIIERLSIIHSCFKELIETRNAQITKLKENTPSIEATSHTQATQAAADKLITQYNLEKEELKERFKNLLHHFSLTRSFIIQAGETIEAKKRLIQASSSSQELTFKGTPDLTNTTNAELLRDILFLKRLKLEAETLLHSLYDFDRTDLKLRNTQTLVEKSLVLATSALSSAAAQVTNAFNQSRTLRYEQTGFSTLPTSIVISTAFNTTECEGATDVDLHTRYIDYVKKMLKKTPVLLDAFNAQRIQFTPITPSTTPDSSAAEKPGAVDTRDEKKGDEAK